MPTKTPTDAVMAARFAAALRRERLHAGLSPAQLASGLRAKPTLVSQLESGRRLPSVRTVLALCRALNCGLSALLPDGPLPLLSVSDAEATATSSAQRQPRSAPEI